MPYRAFSDTPPDDIPLVRRVFERIARIKHDVEAGLKDDEDVKLSPSSEKFETLRKLCLSVQFSEAWRRHVETSALRMALSLSGTKPDHATMIRWKFMGAGQRITLLKSLAEFQAGLFSSKLLDFHPTAIRPESSKTTGAFNFTAANLKDASGTYVTFNDLQKMAYTEAVGCAWHEQLHGLHFQLASALDRGVIGPGHPFYDDAVLMKEKVVNLAHIPARYPAPIYRADVDERLCYKSQSDFSAAYTELSARNVFFSARFGA